MNSEIITINHNEKTITLIPTAHVSKTSVQLVQETLLTHQFDAIYVELDHKRLHAIKNPKDFSSLDLMSVFKRKEIGSLLMHILLSTFQRKIASTLEVPLGAEMQAAIDIAAIQAIPLIPMDRDISITLNRVFNSLSLWQKLNLGVELVLSLFSRYKVDELAIEKLKHKDVLEDALTQLGSKLPHLKRTLIDERDHYMMHTLISSPYRNVVGVIGAAHASGMVAAKDQLLPVASLIEVTHKKTSYIGWLVPCVIVVLIALTFTINPTVGIDSIIRWVLINSIFSAIGAALVFAHPLAIITAFIASPISSLSPLLAAGWFAGLVQMLVSKPNVNDLTSMGEDLLSFKLAFKNKALKVLWVTASTNIFSSIATFIAASTLIENLWKLLFP